MSTRVAASPSPILALDPGKDKCGLAVVVQQGARTKVLAQQIVPSVELERRLPALLEQWRVTKIVIGDATTSRAWRERLSALLPAVEIVPVVETGSTLQARALYWQAKPPRGWRRVLPLSLQVPPEPVDDFAAVVLAQRYFQQQGVDV
jgi:RNase H-fold protein (predicted Holliday junction resolvase)